jgi:hypothetical protein
MLHFGPGMGYICEGNEVVNGIPTKVYKNEFHYESIGGNFTITYHWSGT